MAIVLLILVPKIQVTCWPLSVDAAPPEALGGEAGICFACCPWILPLCICESYKTSCSRSSAELHFVSLQAHDGSLTILGITRDDRGAYTCRAYSDQGEVLHTTRLLVQGTAIAARLHCKCTSCETRSFFIVRVGV